MKIFSIVRVKGQIQQIDMLSPASVNYLNLYYLVFSISHEVSSWTQCGTHGFEASEHSLYL